MFKNMKFYIITSKSISNRHQIILRKLLTRHGAIVLDDTDKTKSTINSGLHSNVAGKKRRRGASTSPTEAQQLSTAALPSHPYMTASLPIHPYQVSAISDEILASNDILKEIPEVDLDFIIADENVLPLLDSNNQKKARTREWVSKCVKLGHIVPFLTPSDNLTKSADFERLQHRTKINSDSSILNKDLMSMTQRQYSHDTTQNSSDNSYTSSEKSISKVSSESNVQQTSNISPSISEIDSTPDSSLNLGEEKCKTEDFKLNSEIIKQLDKLRDYYHLLGDQWRAFAFQKAVAKIKNYPYPITSDTPLKTLGLGEKTRLKVEEIIQHGKCDRLSNMENDDRIAIISSFSKIWGVGGKTATYWCDSLQLKSIQDLKEVVEKGLVRLTRQQEIGLKFYEDLQHRIPRDEVTKIESYVKRVALKLNPNLKIVTCGSYRRGLDTSGDVDILISTTEDAYDPFPSDILSKIVSICTKSGFMTACLGGSYNKDIIFEEDFISEDLNDLEKLEDQSTNPLLDGIENENAHPHEESTIDTTSKSSPISTNTSSIELLRDQALKSSKRIFDESLESTKNSISDDKLQPREVDVIQESSQKTHHSFMGICKLPSSPYHRRIDIKVYHPDVFPFAMLYFTGSDHFNRKMRYHAHQLGYTLSDTSLRPFIRVNGDKIAEGAPIICRTEMEIFKALGMEYKSPVERCL